MGFQVLSNSCVCSQEIGGTREEMQLSDSDWCVFSTSLPHLSTDYLQALYELSAGSLHTLLHTFTYSLHILFTVKSTSSQAPSSASLAKMFFHLHLMISPLPFGNEKESEKPGQLLTPASCHFSLSLKRLIQTAACF